VRLWEVATGREVRTLKGHSVSFSPDGRFLATGMATGSGDKTVKTVTFWEVATGREVRKLEGLSSVTFSPDGRLIASGGGTVTLWDQKRGALLTTLAAVGSEGDYIAWTPEGYFVATPATEQLVALRIGDEVQPLGKHRDRFYRPDLVAKKLAIQPVEVRGPKVDLEAIGKREQELAEAEAAKREQWLKAEQLADGVSREEVLALCDEALDVADGIYDPRWKGRVLVELANEFAKVDKKRANAAFDRALATVNRVLQEADRMTDHTKVGALISVLPQLAKLDRDRALAAFDRALEVANGIKGGQGGDMVPGGSFIKAQVLAKIAGELAKVDRARALRVFDDALEEVEPIRNRHTKAAALSTIVTEMAKVDFDRALKVAEGLTDPGEKAFVLAHVARELAKVDRKRALTLFDRAIREAIPGHSPTVLSAIARELVHVDVERALRVAEGIQGGSPGSPHGFVKNHELLVSIAREGANLSAERALAVAERMLEVTEQMTDPRNKAWKAALAGVLGLVSTERGRSGHLR
ncbi:MAG: hypothetical protein IIC00_11505, partial [Planctomycetes bacterium]|nr:hypothetical protein [Planctomycetota bacterium]